MAVTMEIGGIGVLDITTYPELIVSGQKPMKKKTINGVVDGMTEYVMGQASNVKVYATAGLVAKLKAVRDEDILFTTQTGEKFNMVGCSINSDLPNDTENIEIDLGVIEAQEAYYI